MACSEQETPAMSHTTASDRAHSCRLDVEPLEDRSLPSGLLLSLMPPLVKYLDHTLGLPVSVVAAVGKTDGGKDGIRHNDDSADHGHGDAKRADADPAVGRAAAGLPDAADAVIARTV